MCVWQGITGRVQLEENVLITDWTCATKTDQICACWVRWTDKWIIIHIYFVFFFLSLQQVPSHSTETASATRGWTPPPCSPLPPTHLPLCRQNVNCTKKTHTHTHCYHSLFILYFKIQVLSLVKSNHLDISLCDVYYKLVKGHWWTSQTDKLKPLSINSIQGLCNCLKRWGKATEQKLGGEGVWSYSFMNLMSDSQKLRNHTFWAAVVV